MRAVVLMLPMVVCGCRGLFPHVPQVESASIEVPELLIQRMSADAWSVDAEWDALRLAGDESPFERPRWRLRAAEPADPTPSRDKPAVSEPTWSADGATENSQAADPDVAVEKEERTSAAPRADASWSRFSSMTISEMLDHPDFFVEGPGGRVRGNELLLELTRRDDLVGWNATVLLAQRDPQAAMSLTDHLEQLVRAPLRYDPQTLKAVSLASNTHDESVDTKPAPPTGLRALWKGWPGGLPNDAARDGSANEQAERSPDGAGRTAEVSSRMRAAAAEAWCRVLAAGEGEAPDKLKPVVQAMRDERFPVRVYAELMLGLARWLPPSSIPGLPEIFEPDADGKLGPRVLREAAIESCLLHAAVRRAESDGTTAGSAGVWPESIRRAERDESARVRIVFGRWLAVTGDDAARPVLEDQLQDLHEKVKGEALVSLGVLGSKDAREIILAEARRPNGRLRLAAIEALRHMGMEPILEFAHDDSANVRRTVARQLSHFPELKAAVALRRMLTDRDPQVQKAVVEATSDWPRGLAVPLLMYGIREGVYHTRLECSRRLHRYIDLQDFIDVEESRSQRSAKLLEIAERHGLKLGLLADVQQAGLHENDVNAGLREEVRVLLRDVVEGPHPASRNVAIRRLERMAEADEDRRRAIVSLIESFLFEKETPSGKRGATTQVLSREEAEGVETIYRQVLPAYSAGYRAVAELNDADAAVQAQAARRLADLSGEFSLSPLLLRRAREEVRPGAGDAVYQYLLKAIEHNGSDAAAQLARRALGHYSERIRKTACRYFERHGSPKHGLWLLAAINDRDLGVQLAAIRAAGRCGHPAVLIGQSAVVEKGPDGRFRETSPRQLGLRDLRHDLDRQVRFETAVAMSFLGDPDGMRQLIRYTSSSDVRLRRAAVREMGLTGRSWFVEPLIDLAWTELNHGDDVLEREILASLNRLVDPAERPEGLDELASIPGRVRAWVAWRRSRAGTDRIVRIREDPPKPKNATEPASRE